MKNILNEKKKRLLISGLRFAVIVAPFVIGGIGFCILYQGHYISAFYDALCLYGLQLNIENDQVNMLINISRFAAPCMTVAILFTVLSVLFQNFRVRMKASRKTAVAIHGDSRYIPMFGEKIGKDAIISESVFSFRAPKQVLIFDTDYRMFQYLHEHEKELFEKKDITLYLCTERITRGHYKDQSLQICNFSENCARAFWTDNLVEKNEHCFVIIGFGNYGQEILSQGLMLNVYSANQQIEYHVFGHPEEVKEYRCLHYKMDHFATLKENQTTVESDRDSVIFHSENWYTDRELISRADRIILAYDEEEDNLLILNELNKYFLTNKIYIKVFNEQIISTLWDVDKMPIISFGTDQDMCEPDMILGESTMAYAKMCHAAYCCSVPEEYGGCPKKAAGQCQKLLVECIECEWLNNDWNSNNYFTKYSNVAQADHMKIKEQILLGGRQYPKDMRKGDYLKDLYYHLSDDDHMQMLEIEHLRWMRYHFMYNWDYSSQKQKDKRLHNLLMDFRRLPLEEQKKDEDAYRTMFEIYNLPERKNYDTGRIL